MARTSKIYPLLFAPVYKDYIWGGTRIPHIFNRPSQEGLCAESWEIADRPEGMSVVSNGTMKGMSLHELVRVLGDQLIGNCSHFDLFPLLIKIIDSKQRLSVQVHPNDHTASVYGGEAKTEMWYVLDAEPGAQVFAGLNSGVTRSSFKKAIRDESLEELLRPISVKTGSTIFIPGGRVHAICEGCLLLEIQQNSNTTYRVYDWGRVGADGSPRELHIDKALRVIQWDDSDSAEIKHGKLKNSGSNFISEIIRCQYFHLIRLELSEPLEVTNNGRSFHILFVLKGKVNIEGNGVLETVMSGTSCLLPAALREYSLTPIENNSVIVRISL